MRKEVCYRAFAQCVNMARAAIAFTGPDLCCPSPRSVFTDGTLFIGRDIDELCCDCIVGGHRARKIFLHFERS